MSNALGPRSRRLFLAVWPSDDLRASIERVSREPVERTGGRAIPARNLHITLLFLGEVASSQFDQVTAAAGEVGGEPFEITFDHIETWPGSNVLCLTSKHPPPGMRELSEKLHGRLVSLGVDFRRHAFRPHVTLARDVQRMRVTEAIEPLSWPVDEFVLVESNMTKTGSEYTVIARWRLRRPTRAETGQIHR